MQKRKKLWIIGAGLSVVFIVGLWCAFRYAPFTFVGSNPEVDSLIEQLASPLSPPTFSGDPPHFYVDEIFDNPEWDPTAQQVVSAAYYKLKAMGKDAFPYLINHFNDDRYSHHRSYATYVPQTVGEACRLLINEQVDVRGIMYKARESPNGTVMGYEFETYVYSQYGSYAAWWRANRNCSLREIRIATVKWRIKKEKQSGFVSDEQRDSILDELDRALAEAQQEPERLELPPPEWYTVDELVYEYQMRNVYRKNSREQSEQ